MSRPVIIGLGEGILRRVAVPAEGGPVLAVRLLAAGGPVPLRTDGIPGEAVTLVAVHLHHRTRTRPKRSGQILVRRKTIETPIPLGHGRVLAFASHGDAPIDALTVRPEDPSTGPWLEEAALEEVCGKPVRLEIHHVLPLDGQGG